MELAGVISTGSRLIGLEDRLMPIPSSALYREIPLTQGRVALVDAADFDRLNQWKWYCSKGYATRNSHVGEGRSRKIYMHREILGSPLKSHAVDHMNGDGLDNRRANLRRCTLAENTRNQRAQTRKAGLPKGVYFKKDRGKFRAQIKVDGKRLHLGYRTTAEEAHQLYREAANRLHGQFARFA